MKNPENAGIVMHMRLDDSLDSMRGCSVGSAEKGYKFDLHLAVATG